MRGRSDGVQKKRVITSLCIVAIFLGFLYVYYGSIFGAQNRGSSALEYGSRSLRKLGYLGSDEDAVGKQESSTKFGLDDGDDEFIAKSFPVSSNMLNLVYLFPQNQLAFASPPYLLQHSMVSVSFVYFGF